MSVSFQCNIARSCVITFHPPLPQAQSFDFGEVYEIPFFTPNLNPAQNRKSTLAYIVAVICGVVGTIICTYLALKTGYQTAVITTAAVLGTLTCMAFFYGCISGSKKKHLEPTPVAERRSGYKAHLIFQCLFENVHSSGEKANLNNLLNDMHEDAFEDFLIYISMPTVNDIRIASVKQKDLKHVLDLIANARPDFDDRKARALSRNPSRHLSALLNHFTSTSAHKWIGELEFSREGHYYPKALLLNRAVKTQS